MSVAKDHSLRFIRTRGWRLSFKPTGEVSYHYNPLVAKAALDRYRLEHKRALALKSAQEGAVATRE